MVLYEGGAEVATEVGVVSAREEELVKAHFAKRYEGLWSPEMMLEVFFNEVDGLIYRIIGANKGIGFIRQEDVNNPLAGQKLEILSEDSTGFTLHIEGESSLISYTSPQSSETGEGYFTAYPSEDTDHEGPLERYTTFQGAYINCPDPHSSLPR